MYKNNEVVQKSWQVLNRIFARTRYAMNFKWLGFIVNQMPQDLIVYQEIIFDLKPDLIIETGVAFGGSTIFFASILNMCKLYRSKVIGIDNKLLETTVKNIKTHPLGKKIILMEGSSIDDNIVNNVYELAKGKKVIVCLDSDHTHKHVLAELKAYSPLAEYIIVNDTGIEDLPATKRVRHWGKGNNPKTAVLEFLKQDDNFEIDEIESRIVLTSNPSGYLKRVK